MITEQTDHGEKIIEKDVATSRLQTFFDSIALFINQGKVPGFTLATVPDATKNERMVIYVSDATGGPTIAFSDGINWRIDQSTLLI